MPYADPEKRKAAKLAYYKRRLAEDPEFREAEKARAAQWIVENRDRQNVNLRASRIRKLLGLS